MVKGDKFTYDCGKELGTKDFTVTYIWECSPVCGGNTLYGCDEN